MQTLEIIRERHYEHYDIRDEVWNPEGAPDLEPHLMKKLAYSKQGDWIGSSKEAYRLVKRFGIEQFEKTEEDHCVCSIGYSPSEKKWYGWSHRAIYGFTIGSTCKKGDCHYTPKTFAEIQVDCHCRQEKACHADASYPLAHAIPGNLDSELIAVGPIENVEICALRNCLFALGKGEWIAKTMEDAKQMAIDFAEGVS